MKQTKEIMAVNRQPLIKPPSSVQEASDPLYPAQFVIDQNYPNPFNPETWIQFQMPEQGEVNISIYNLQGQLVRNLTTQSFGIGVHKIKWDGKDNYGLDSASGVYFVRAHFKNHIQLKKLVKMK